MNIIVCVKQVPEVSDAELEISHDGSDIERDDLVETINEWDNYAVEEAVRLKELHGGRITVVTLGDEECEDVLRRALAMGADDAILIDEGGFEGSDGLGIARGLAAAIRELQFDLVLTGAMSADTGWAQVGVALAELLGVPHASLAVRLEVQDDRVLVHRELESNTLEEVELSVPCLVTVQTGINTPRYVSIMGIRRVRDVEIRELDADDLGLAEHEIGLSGSSVARLRLSLPLRGEGAEILEGNLDTVCDRTAEIIRERGGLE